MSALSLLIVRQVGADAQQQQVADQRPDEQEQEQRAGDSDQEAHFTCLQAWRMRAQTGPILWH